MGKFSQKMSPGGQFFSIRGLTSGPFFTFLKKVVYFLCVLCYNSHVSNTNHNKHMKVTEAIEQLQKVLQEHGNLDLEFTDTDQGGYWIAKHITVDTVQQWVDFGTENQHTESKLVAVVIG